MKFTDGQWLMQPGVTAHYAAQNYHTRVLADRLVMLVTHKPIRHRGDTLAGPTLTVTVASPAEGVIRISTMHYAASQPPRLHVPMPGAQNVAVEIVESDACYTLTSGSLSVDVSKGEAWSLTFREGNRVLTRSEWRGMGYVQWSGKGNFMHDQLSLEAGECVYGLGERFTPFVKNG